MIWLLGAVATALAAGFVVVGLWETFRDSQWRPRRRCAAVLEPGRAGPYFGRCELRRGHAGCHLLERGMEAVEFSTVVGAPRPPGAALASLMQQGYVLNSEQRVLVMRHLAGEAYEELSALTRTHKDPSS